MKNQKGMTLISVMIYVIVLTFVVGTLAILQRYFYRNTEETTITSQFATEHSRFLTYITDDINSGLISKENSKFQVTDLQFVMKDWSVHEYKFQNNTIFYIILDPNGTVKKSISICKNVQSCTFTYLDGTIKSNINIGGRIFNNTFNL